MDLTTQIATRSVNSTGVYNIFKKASDNQLEGYTGELEIITKNITESEAESRIIEVSIYMKRYEALCSVLSDFFSFIKSSESKVEILFPDEVSIIIKSPSVDATYSNKENLKLAAGDIYAELLNAKTSYYDWSNAPYFLKPTQSVTIGDVKIPVYGEDLPL